MPQTPRRLAALALLIPLTTFAAACGSSGEPTPGTGSDVAVPSKAPTPTAGKDAASTDLKALVGLSESEARARAEGDGYVVRVIFRDGEPLPATKDFRPDRVNLAVEDGVVTGATSG